jgi:D-alanyl-D-alanine carboxypeptidase/D-alanyl-D-alanine-endopeptidase (penicillin-binding protein 4)
VVSAVAGDLARKVERVRDVVVDDTHFGDPLTVPGVSSSLEPYDAPNGALCVNFNTVSFRREKGRYISAEAQTPLLPSVEERIRSSGRASGRIALSRSRRETSLYAGELFAHFLMERGVTVEGTVKTGEVEPALDRLLLRHRSPYTLDEVLEGMLAYSSNFTANQLLIASGVAAYGPPGNLKKGVDALRAFAGEELGLGPLDLEEGSGISRKNRLTARQLVRVLEAFAPLRHLLPREDGQWYKTGTLSGVSTRAGYLQDGAGGLWRFAVMINTPGKRADRVVEQWRNALPR